MYEFIIIMLVITVIYYHQMAQLYREESEYYRKEADIAFQAYLDLLDN